MSAPTRAGCQRGSDGWGKRMLFVSKTRARVEGTGVKAQLEEGSGRGVEPRLYREMTENQQVSVQRRGTDWHILL